MARPLATRAHILGARCGLSTLGAHRPSFWFVLGCPGAGATRWSKHIPIPPPPRPRRGASRLRLAASPSPPPHPPPPPGPARHVCGGCAIRGRGITALSLVHWPVRCKCAPPLACAARRGGLWRKAAAPPLAARSATPATAAAAGACMYWYAPRAPGACAEAWDSLVRSYRRPAAVLRSRRLFPERPAVPPAVAFRTLVNAAGRLGGGL